MSFADFMTRIQRVDNRVIRIVCLLAIVVPLIRPLPVPMRVTTGPQTLYDYIEKMSPGDVLLMDLYMSAAYRPTLYGTIEAVFAHAVRRGLRVIWTSTQAEGPMFAEQAIEAIAVPAGLVYGKDYVHLGYRAGGEGAVAEFLRSFHDAFRTDFHGTAIDQIPLMQEVKSEIGRAHV